MCFVLEWKIGLETSCLASVLPHQTTGHPFISIPSSENRDCNETSSILT